MDAQPNENFFEITVSQEGSDRIMRLFKTVRFLFAFSIVLGIIFIGVGYLRFIFYSRLTYSNNPFFKAESVLLPVYTVLLTVLMFGQLYSFFHFTRLCKKSIQLRQADLFNYSFKWLIRSALFSGCMFIIEILMSFFTMTELIYLLRVTPAS
jgi:hypothetical protein